MDQVLVERSGTYELVDASNLEADAAANLPTAQPQIAARPGDEGASTTPAEHSSQVASTPAEHSPQVGSTPAATRPVTSLENVRPASSSLKSTSQPLLHTDHYKMFERTATARQVKRPMSAKVQRTPVVSDKEAIEKKEMADAAFDHWKRQKDREQIRKKREKKKEEEHKEAWAEKNGVGKDSAAFTSWLHNKSRQQSQQRQVEKIRAQIITSELLAVDYTASELAYERWLKRKNQSKIVEKRERNRRTREDREEMKEVLHSMKTRWNIDYKKSHYLHPNSIQGWDSTPLYSTSI